MSTEEQGEIERLRRELDVAEARIKAAEQRAGAAEERANKTTFPELLALCHNHLSNNLQVETDATVAIGIRTTVTATFCH